MMQYKVKEQYKNDIMKKSITTLYYFWFIITTAFVGCTKHTDPKPAPAVAATSQWTFNGHSYKVTGASFDDFFHTLTASDDAGAVGGGNYVDVLFGSVVRPTNSGTLTVVNVDATANPSNCVVEVGNIYDIAGHASTGMAGDNVAVTVSSTGKLTATFSNITVTAGPTGTDTLHVSGTIIEN